MHGIFKKIPVKGFLWHPLRAIPGASSRAPKPIETHPTTSLMIPVRYPHSLTTMVPIASNKWKIRHMRLTILLPAATHGVIVP